MSVAPQIDMCRPRQADRGSQAMVEGIRQGYLATTRPLCITWPGGSSGPRKALLDLGIQTYSAADRALRRLADVAGFSAE